ncbi:MAG: GGDEF domain-containing protein [Thermoleophilia bacterium]|nr:GGDEF domain-containing protein [Thermoleophilia bacterium]
MSEPQGEWMDEIVTAALAAASAVALAVLTLTVAWRRASSRSERRLEAALLRLDDTLVSVSQALERSARETAPAGARVSELALTLDLAELLERVASEAAARTGADAGAIRVLGPGGSVASASAGLEDAARLLEAPLAAPGSPSFRALSLAWSYAAGEEREDAIRSALVVPIAEDGVGTGALAAFARSAAAFRAEHARALEELAAEAAPGLANARRFAEAELRAVTDALTGVRNRRGYDEELAREVARARRTGRPLSLLLLDLDDFSVVNKRFDFPGGDQVLREFAEQLRRAARATDIVCRRGGEEFALVLPETTGEEATVVDARLRQLVAVTVFSNVGRLEFSSGLVQWRPEESPDSLDARASACVTEAKRRGKGQLVADLP